MTDRVPSSVIDKWLLTCLYLFVSFEHLIYRYTTRRVILPKNPLMKIIFLYRILTYREINSSLKNIRILPPLVKKEFNKFIKVH